MSDTHTRGDSDPGEGGKPSLLLRGGLFIYTALILAIGWGYGLWQINADRRLTLASSENQLTLVTTGFANHVTAMIHDGVGAAAAASNEVRSDRQPLSDDHTRAVLARMLTGGEYVRTLFVATPTYYSAAHRQPDPNSSARPSFVDSMLATRESTWVGMPLNIEQGDSNVVVPIAKRVSDIGGEPTWAGALISFAWLDALYQTLPVDHIGLALSHPSGTLLVRVPTLPGYKFAGANISDSDSTREYLRQSDNSIITYVAPDPFTGNPRQFSVRRLEDYPLRATASRDIENTLLDWRTRTRNSILTLSAASIALIGLTAALSVVLRRRFQAIKSSRERFQLAAGAANDGIWDWELKTNRVYYSPRLKELLGYSERDAFAPSPDTFWDMMHPDDLGPIREQVGKHLRERARYDVEYRARTKSGEYRWFRARAQAVWDAAGQAVRMAGSIADIHERKLAERSLRAAQERELHAREEFARHLLDAQERERQRLANELHDSVGQNLSLIKNRASMALQDSALPEDAARHVQALSILAAETIADVRRVAHALRPLHIEALGFTDALNTMVTKLDESSRLSIGRQIENVDDAVKGAAATHLYRIAQEALNNIIKHSRALRCTVTLERDLHCVRLVIGDDGVGFDVSQPLPPASRGIGMGSMQERARLLNAQWEIRSTPGQGTVVRIELPIDAHAIAENAAAQ